MKTASIIQYGFAAAVAIVLAACGGDGSGQMPGPQSAAPVTVRGIVSDGPVVGGTLFVFEAGRVTAAMAAADAATDRGGALAAAEPLLTVSRAAEDGDAFTFDVPVARAGQALFLVFDANGAEDEQFNDTPPNMESVAILRAASPQTINVSPHTTAIAQAVRSQLDPDGDGTPIAAAAIENALLAGERNVLGALGRDDDGEDLFAGGESPIDTGDIELLHAASAALGLQIRMLAALEGLAVDDILAALSADASDGDVDGEIPADFGDADVARKAGEIATFLKRDDDDGYGGRGAGPCSRSAVTLRRACAVDVIDDLLEGRGICAGIADDERRSECLESLADEQSDAREECREVFEARIDVCAALGDSAHEPPFGPAFADNFVDPREIGGAVEPNPFFPLVPGSQRIYEKTFVDDEGETITETLTTTVTDELKLIDGIPCLVVRDFEESSEGSGEDTDDWFAQDVDGNVWYCGEISRELETFEGDDPEEAEIVSVEGSWKAERDGAKAGMLIPAQPEVGAWIRQELLYGEAEDVIEIVATDATESAPGGACAGDCLQTRDFSPLEPGNEESKFYAPGVGLIVEIDPESGERLELIELTLP